MSLMRLPRHFIDAYTWIRETYPLEELKPYGQEVRQGPRHQEDELAGQGTGPGCLPGGLQESVPVLPFDGEIRRIPWLVVSPRAGQRRCTTRIIRFHMEVSSPIPAHDAEAA